MAAPVFSTFVVVKRSTWTNCSATGAGGAVALLAMNLSEGCGLQIEDCGVHDCASAMVGGGVGVLFSELVRNFEYLGWSNIFENNRASYGGGVGFNHRHGAERCEHSVNHSQFYENQADETGGALSFLFEASPTHSIVQVDDSTFSSNTARDGAGVAVVALDLRDEAANLPYSIPTNFTWNLMRCKLLDNEAVQYGGGLLVLTDFQVRHYVHETKNSTFRGNSAGSNGGAIAVLALNLTASKILVHDVELHGNSASGDGGALFIGPAPLPSNESLLYPWETTTVNIDLCTFKDNSVKRNGGAFFLDTSYFAFDGFSEYVVTDSDFLDNSATQSGGAVGVRNVPPAGDDCLVRPGPDASLCLAHTVFDKCTFKNNEATQTGGGIYAYGQVDLSVESSEMLSNHALSGSAILVASLGETAAATSGTARIAKTSLKATRIVARELVKTTPSLIELSTLAAIELGSGNSIFCPGARIEDEGIRTLNDDDSILEIAGGGNSLFTLRTATSPSVKSWQVFCVACPVGQYILCPANTTHPGVLNTGEPCLLCPKYATCPGGGQVLTTPGFWRCVDPSCDCSSESCDARMIACPEGFCEAGNTCGAGREPPENNILCGKCKPGYSPIGSECRDCTAETEWLWIPTLLLSWVWVLYLLYLCQTTLTAKKKIFMYFVQTLRVVLGPTSLWSSWTAAFNLTISKYICLGQRTSVDLIWTGLATPLLYLAIFLFTWAGHVVWSKFFKKTSTKDHFHLHIPMVRWPKWGDIAKAWRKHDEHVLQMTERLVDDAHEDESVYAHEGSSVQVQVAADSDSKCEDYVFPDSGGSNATDFQSAAVAADNGQERDPNYDYATDVPETAGAGEHAAAADAVGSSRTANSHNGQQRFQEEHQQRRTSTASGASEVDPKVLDQYAVVTPEAVAERKATYDQQVQEHQRDHTFLRGIHFLMLFTYETLTEQAMQLVNCQNVCHLGRRLAEYPDVSCTSPSYQILRIVALAILVYTAFFPIGLFGFLFKNRFDLHTPYFIGKYGVFFDHYTRAQYWWQVQELVRRVVILSVYVVFFVDTTVRTYAVFVTCLGILVMHLWALPFHSHTDNFLEGLSLLMLTYAAGTKVAYPGSTDKAVDVMQGVLIPALIILAFSAVSELGYYHVSRLQRNLMLRMRAYKQQLTRH
eukprot:m.351836 g.351836  ORF g.351836 m.351836 type:complete len:1161 (-) comp19898_c13_seq1:28-3510(-)